MNLGCGRRCFGDYINVDIFDVCPVPEVKYVRADISQKLPFEDNYADEIFTCHVIEHLWPWDVDRILAEWVRVLKPGGRLVTECPNIVGTAMILLAADVTGDRMAWKLAMNALYGDPAPNLRNIEERHKWGYSPKSLIALKQRLGLQNVRQEPAVFKMKEPRDMRIVGEKCTTR